MKIAPFPLFMGTSKPVSTICYNTEDFLFWTLEKLLENGKIEDFRYIFHYKEGVDKKDHFHLIVFPSGVIDTRFLISELTEPDPSNPTKPFVPLPFRHSEPLSWLLYAVHDPDYLFLHAVDTDGDGKIPYDVKNIVCWHQRLLDEDWCRAQHLRLSTTQKIVSAILSGLTFRDVLASIPNANPVQTLAIFRGLSIADFSPRFDE